jgi:hypothetical protein
MNWEAVSAVAQLIATLGLFASLIYATAQLRQSTRLARITAEGTAAAAFRDAILPIATDTDLARIWQQGLTDPRSLEPVDGLRFYILAFQALKGAEAVHSSYVGKVMDEDTWTGWNTVFTMHIRMAGLRHYWHDRQDMFAPTFREYVAAVHAMQIPPTVVGPSQ